MFFLRKAMAEDCVSMWRVRTRAIDSISESYYPKVVIQKWAGVSMADDFSDAFHQIEAVVCEYGDHIIGWGFANLAFSKIDAVFVEPTCFGKGVGSRIVKEFEVRGLEVGLESIELTSTVNAALFYSKLGYQILGETLFDHPAGFSLAAFRMGKSLKR